MYYIISSSWSGRGLGLDFTGSVSSSLGDLGEGSVQPEDGSFGFK